jgi:hypothetical protein
MIATLTACGSFDASGYVQACLDANAHGEFTAYAEITNTSEAEIQQKYDEMLDTEISYLDAYNADDATKEKFRNLFMDIYGSFQYEVGEAVQNDDKSYTVPVTVRKLKVFQNIQEDGQNYINSYAESEVNAGRTPTTEDLYGVVMEYMYNELSSNLAAKEYEEPVTTNLSVTPTDSNARIYSIDETQLQALLESMIDIENAK